MIAKCYNCLKICRGEKMVRDEYKMLDIPSKLSEIIECIETNGRMGKKRTFCDNTGINKALLSLYLANKREISRNHIDIIKKMYGVDFSYIDKSINLEYSENERIEMRVDQDFKSRLINQAKKEKISITQLIIRVLSEYLDKNKSL